MATFVGLTVLLAAVSYISADADEQRAVGGGGCADEAAMLQTRLNLSSLLQLPAALTDTDGEAITDLVGVNPECRPTSDFGASYRGSVSTTYGGKTCQQWTSQWPHTHSVTPSNYPHSGLGYHNYCRNPDGGDMPWCYTTDSNTRWEYCSQIPVCCRLEFDRGASFRGNAATTVTGRICQKWTSQWPHTHSVTPSNYPHSGLGYHNYCRNPDGGDKPWCYTTDSKTRWEYCSIPICTSPSSCPSSCEYPNAHGGSEADGGQYLETHHGKCINWLGKPYGDDRYCGVGSSYNHIDCGGCRPNLARGEERAMTLCMMASHVYSMSSHTSIPRDLDASSDFAEFREIDRQGYGHPTSSWCHQQENGGAWPPAMALFVPAFCVYLRSVDMQAVLAIKGTSPSSADDVLADIQSAIGGASPEYAKSFLGNVINNLKHHGFTVLVTGHSLGGYIAEILATTHDLPGMVFQAPGPDSHWNPHNGPHSPSDFIIVNAATDPIGNGLNQVFYHKKDPVYMDGLRSHSVTEMCARFDPYSMIHITNKNVMSSAYEWYGYYYIG